MQSYLDAYVNVFLIRRAKQYDYQNETVNSTLAIWIGYLLEDEGQLILVALLPMKWLRLNITLCHLSHDRERINLPS